MQVLLADEYGFCFGVERAVEMVEDAISSGETVRSLGPLIHNKQEMQRFSEYRHCRAHPDRPAKRL
jgi:4-hydroxy-3-methylbut-2-enyl diphosphate reductase